MTVDIPEHIAKRIHAFVAGSGRMSVTGLVNRAILNELEQAECDTEKLDALADLRAQLQELRRGQLALIAMVDSSATVLASLLRSHGAGKEVS